VLLSGHSEESISAIHEVAIDELVWVGGAGERGGGAHMGRLEEDYKKYLEWEGVCEEGEE